MGFHQKNWMVAVSVRQLLVATATADATDADAVVTSLAELL